jgi:hypothetical protein
MSVFISPLVTAVDFIPYYARPSVIEYKSLLADEGKLLTSIGDFATIAEKMKLLNLDIFIVDVCRFYYNILSNISGIVWTLDPCAEYKPA